MQKYKKLWLSTLFVLMSAAAGLTFGGHAQDSTGGRRQAEEATPVSGPPSERQREHGRLFNVAAPGRKKLRELAQEAPGGAEISVGILPPQAQLPYYPAGQAPPPAPDPLREMAGGADAIVVGTVRQKTSQLTADETFVFTDYELAVEDVLKDNPAAHVEPGCSITVARPGGKILLDGRVVTASDSLYKPLGVGGRYILFLRFIPATGAYRPFTDKGSFEVSGGRVSTLTEGALSSTFRAGREASALLDEIRAAVSEHARKGGDNR